MSQSPGLELFFLEKNSIIAPAAWATIHRRKNQRYHAFCMVLDTIGTHYYGKSDSSDSGGLLEGTPDTSGIDLP